MATTTATRATKSAAENVNAAATAASQATTKSVAESRTRRSRIVVAGVPVAEVTHTTATPVAAQPKRVDIESLTEALQTKGTAKLSEHAKPAEKPDTATSAPTVQTEAPKPEAQPRELTAEEKAAQLQKEIERKTAALQTALKELARKKELNDHRTRFLKTLDQLGDAEKQLNETDEFEATNSKICFETKPDNYRWETAFSIGNADLQREFITFIREKIRAKVEQIEAELIK